MPGPIFRKGNAMKTVFAGDLDDVAATLADQVRHKETDAALTDAEKTVFNEAFRAGVTVMYRLSLDAGTHGMGTWKSLMLCVGGQVIAWDLPLVATYGDTEPPDATH
jgi:hypothetical protein